MNFADADFLDWSCAHPDGVADQFQQRLANGTELQVWDSGVLVAEPAQAGDKQVVISCAVHGNETAPIEMLRDMVADVRSGKLVLTQRTLFLIANPASINAGRRFVEENMNRLFTGEHSNEPGMVNPERERAAKLEQYVQQFFNAAKADEKTRFHYDLHTAIRDSEHEKFAVYPFLHGKPYSKEQLSFLRDCGVTTILLNQEPTTTFSYFSSAHCDAHAFTVELGKVKPFGENDMRRFADADRSLRRLISESAPQWSAFDSDKHQIYEVARTINRTQQDFRLHFADNVANFTPFQQGELLATDGDTEYRVEQPQERIIFPNAKVAIGQRALLTVVEIPAQRLQLV